MSSRGFSRKDFSQFLGPYTRLLLYFERPTLYFLMESAKVKMLILLLRSTFLAELSYLPLKPSTHDSSRKCKTTSIWDIFFLCCRRGAPFSFQVKLNRSSTTLGDWHNTRLYTSSRLSVSCFFASANRFSSNLIPLLMVIENLSCTSWQLYPL